MNNDRTAICEIISEMLDNPTDDGIFHTTVAYDKLEALLQETRFMAIGWAHADVRSDLDAGLDPRQNDIADIIARAKIDFAA